jgi:hypothetical protein
LDWFKASLRDAALTLLGKQIEPARKLQTFDRGIWSLADRIPFEPNGAICVFMLRQRDAAAV